MRRIVGALACLSLPAQANELFWMGDRNKEQVSLVYGIPESSHAPLSFSCKPGSGTLTFAYGHEPIDAVDGMNVDVPLQAGEIELLVRTKGIRMEMDDLFVLDGRIAPDTNLADLILSRGTLFVFIEDEAEEFPLDATADNVQGLIDGCRAP